MTFLKPGIVQVFCHIHADMSAIVLVLANPFFASPDENHHFVIDDVPEGDYTIVAYHEHIKPISRRIHIAAGQTTPGLQHSAAAGRRRAERRLAGRARAPQLAWRQARGAWAAVTAAVVSSPSGA